MNNLLKAFLLLLLLYSQQVVAQATFFDQSTNSPIPSVNIYNSKGNLIGFSNKEGKVEIIPELKKLVSYPLKVVVQHISYVSKSIELASGTGEQVIYLIPSANLLQEIVLSKRSSDFVCIRGYFRCLETFDLKHKYYADGIAEFYIPLHKKGKVKYKLLDYRVYRDSAVVDDYDEKMGPFFQAPHIVQLKYGKLMDRLSKYEIIEKEKQHFSILKNKVEVGNIQEADQSITFYKDGVLPDTVEFEKIFRIEAKVRHEVSIENYANTPLATASPKDLRRVYQVITGSIKRKAEHGHIPYEVINELYVLDRRFLSTQEVKSIAKTLTSNTYKVPKKSSYARNFWEDLESYAINPVNDGLASQIGDNLKLVE